MMRSWLFDFGGGHSGIQTDPGGGIALVDGDAAIRQSILLLLATMPGERVMRPDYGCDLHRLMFAPADETTAGLAIHYVTRALERWEPRIELLHVDAVVAAHEPSRLDLIIDYRIRHDGRHDRVVHPVALGTA
jgi:phage baseplate assembly protein W